MIKANLAELPHKRTLQIEEYDFSDEKLKDTAGIRLPKIAT